MKKCLVISNTYKDAARILAKEVEKFLVSKNFSVTLVEFCGESRTLSLDQIEFVITLGGDGTVLYAARQCSKLDIPIFPINLGEFGFIAGIQPDCWKDRLTQFINKKEVLAKRGLVSGTVFRNGIELISYNALNDVVFSSKNPACIVSLCVKADNISFGTFKADGVIVCTPTGSTAYSAAAGGPILDPRLDALILNPVSAFSLSNRPLVLPPQEVLSIKVLPSRNAKVVVTWDGQCQYDLLEGDVVIVKKSVYSIRLAGCGTDTFYNALRSKLHWSGGPHA